MKKISIILALIMLVGILNACFDGVQDKPTYEFSYEIEKTEILQLDPFKRLGKPAKIAAYFGGKAGYLKAIQELKEELYKAG